MDPREGYAIGIDVGGTFTDLFVWAPDGATATFKVLSTPEDPSVGVVEGLAAIAAAQDLDVRTFAGRVRTIVHGTTVTTNAVLTRRGAKTGLLTTAGVRDALEMRRGIRESHYDNRLENVKPLVPRRLRLPVRGRLDARGTEVAPLSLEDVRAAADVLAREGVEAVAVCFMSSYAHPAHERAAAEMVRAALPGAFVSVSSETLPAIRFYDRVSTTVLDAYVGPVLGRYIDRLRARLFEAGFGGVLLVMQSSGGVASPEVVAHHPATTLLSGPAAGPRAGLAMTEPLGWRSCLVVDMGGTSFDASLVREGEVGLRVEGDLDRLRIALPMLDIVTIGAGGGSLGWIDGGGLLRVGPQSAGAAPGPACYGRGGDRPTVTDADLVLGYLDAKAFAGGKLPLREDLARRAIETHVARPLGLGIEEAAAGMYRVINANMAHGVRAITVERGLDPREFPMVVAGGAAPLHACAIALELEIPTLVVPAVASTLCASGMLLTDLQHDRVRSLLAAFDDLAPARLEAMVAAMVTEGEAELAAEDVSPDRRRHVVSLDLRYRKQYHEVTVTVPRDAVERGDWAAVAETFHREHDRLYGYELRGEGTGIELVNVRVRSIGSTDRPPLASIETGGADPSGARAGERRAFVPERGSFAPVPVYDGHRLRAGNRLVGPALVDRTDTTLLVTESFEARMDERGTLVCERRRP